MLSIKARTFVKNDCCEKTSCCTVRSIKRSGGFKSTEKFIRASQGIRWKGDSHLLIHSQILVQYICILQVRERLRVALERNSTLEDELASTKEEVSKRGIYVRLKKVYVFTRLFLTWKAVEKWPIGYIFLIGCKVMYFLPLGGKQYS